MRKIYLSESQVNAIIEEMVGKPEIPVDVTQDVDSSNGDKNAGMRKAKQRIVQAGIKPENVTFTLPSEKVDEGIKIDPENKGKFNATKKRTGKSTEELTHSKNPVTKKRAVFAKNAANWKKGVHESYDPTDGWYDEEDYAGKTGRKGLVRSYDIGTYYMSQAEEDAKENGYDNVADYLQYWFDEIKSECPWYWQETGSGYGYNGTTIFRNGGVVCKNIYDQIMIDEYPFSVPSTAINENYKVTTKRLLEAYKRKVMSNE